MLEQLQRTRALIDTVHVAGEICYDDSVDGTPEDMGGQAGEEGPAVGEEDVGARSEGEDAVGGLLRELVSTAVEDSEATFEERCHDLLVRGDASVFWA